MTRKQLTQKFFKRTDFDFIPNQSLETRQAVTDFCNGKIEREGKVVYSNDRTNIWAGGEPREGAKYSALLIAIEPMCTHPNDKVTDSYGDKGFEGYVCECGARVKPSKFEEAE